MAHDFSAVMQTTWTTNLQNHLQKSFVGMKIANTKFDGSFRGTDTVKFPRQQKIVIGTLTSFRQSLTKQDITTTGEDFSLDQYRYFAFDIALDEDIETYIDPKSQAYVDAKEGFSNEFDKAILGHYVDAGYTIDDGDMETASNGGTGNAIAVSKANIYDMFTAVSEVMDVNYIPQNDRWIMISPKESRKLKKSPEMQKSTVEAERRILKGVIGMLDDLMIYYSNNLAVAAGVRHILAGQGKPICFASNVKPSIYVGSIKESDDFTYLVKGATKFGTKVFTEGSEKLIDVEVVA